MGNSSQQYPVNPPDGAVVTPARTVGTLGINDHADTNVTSLKGDTPGTTGINDHADPDKLPVAAGSDQKKATGAAKGKCPTQLTARDDEGKLDIDWAWIGKREGTELKGYVPAAGVSKSGVTIGTGVDLGARNAADIDRLGISAELKTKLKPYCGKKTTDAKKYLKEHPLTITKEQAESLDKAVKGPITKTLVSSYNTAVDAAEKKESCKRVHFEKLPQSVQTAIASITFQYGTLSSEASNYWEQVTEQRWQDAVDNLKEFGDAYPSRRKLEAGLIKSAIKSASEATAK